MKSIVVPIKIISLENDSFHLLVEIVVFKETHWAVLDTGASRSVFDKNFMEKHLPILRIEEESQAATIFSTNQTVVGEIPSWQIGRLTLSNYTAIGLDLSGVSDTYQTLGHPAIKAIIGGDILMQNHAKIDYKKATLRFYR
ncbi:MAG: hypothetical protein EOO99_02220 [Pedobacter sp.]|nr:MAG: hypothetical protein EOO99_02220 [Pedobacter sp.]